jgi:hypothetical protein
MPTKFWRHLRSETFRSRMFHIGKVRSVRVDCDALHRQALQAHLAEPQAFSVCDDRKAAIRGQIEGRVRCFGLVFRN